VQNVQKASGELCHPGPLPWLCPWTPLGTSVPESPDWPLFNLGLSGGIPQTKFRNPPKFDETEEPEVRIHGWMTLTKMLVPICLYCLNCTKFDQLILRKIIKIVATRCQILRLKCTEFDMPACDRHADTLPLQRLDALCMYASRSKYKSELIITESDV